MTRNNHSNSTTSGTSNANYNGGNQNLTGPSQNQSSPYYVHLGDGPSSVGATLVLKSNQLCGNSPKKWEIRQEPHVLNVGFQI